MKIAKYRVVEKAGIYYPQYRNILGFWSFYKEYIGYDYWEYIRYYDLESAAEKLGREHERKTHKKDKFKVVKEYFFC